VVVAIWVAFKRKNFFLLFGLPLAIVVMHVSWGSGFLWSMFFQKSGIKSR
jgi:hypothetical protein